MKHDLRAMRFNGFQQANLLVAAQSKFGAAKLGFPLERGLRKIRLSDAHSDHLAKERAKGRAFGGYALTTAEMEKHTPNKPRTPSKRFATITRSSSL